MGAQGEEKPSDTRVTRLFDEYRSAKDRAEQPDVDGLLARAGAAQDELLDRIRVFDELSALSTDLDHRDELPATLGRFEILHRLGSGGIARVYLARDPNLDRQVALKVLDKNLVPDRRERAWVLNEARSLAVLEHEGVVRVFEVGHADGFDYVAVEHLTGPSLAQVVFELRRVQLGTHEFDDSEPSDARRIAIELTGHRARARCMWQIASALAYCHNRGVIHRDVKPENVVFDGAGVPKLIDFGLAHLEGGEGESQTRITQQLIGSAAYVAPEQVEANQTGADPRSDQFSLSTLCYELLALENPFDAGTAQLTTAAVLECEPPKLRRRVANLPVELATIIEHGLAREPNDRYPSVQALADDLDAWLAHRPISVAPPSIARRSALWLRRNRRNVALAASAVFLLVSSSFAMWARGVTARRDRIVDELAQLDPSELRTPDEFSQSGLVLNRLIASADEFDAGLGHGVFGVPLVPELDRVTHAWSRAISAAYRFGGLLVRRSKDELAPEPKMRGGVFYPGMNETQDAGWRYVFLIEEDVCPDCPYNVAERARGTLTLPSTGELDGMRYQLQIAQPPPSGSPPFLLEYRAVARPYPRRPPQGAFRFIAAKENASELAFESRFVVSDVWPPALAITLRPVSPDFLEDALEVPRATVEYYGSIHATAFRISPNEVTRREFENFQASPEYDEYLKERGGEPVVFDETRGLDDAVWVDIDSASAYCRWLGGRLPSLEELMVARSSGVLQPEREWVSNVAWMENTWSGTYFADESTPENPSGMSFGHNPLRRRLVVKDQVVPTFRVAVSSDHPDEYFDDIAPAETANSAASDD